MKKCVKVLVLFTVICAALLSGCGNANTAGKLLSKEGIAPYELSEGEKYVMQSFGMDDTSQIIAFNAPKEAISLNVNVYCLGDDETWINTGRGGISIGVDREPTEQLVGAFTMQLKENYAIDYRINADGLYSFKSDEIVPNDKIVASSRLFLNEFQEISLNTEIPVALMVHDSETKLYTYTLQDYFAPSKFAGIDLVQVVTLEFSTSEFSDK